MTMNALDKMEDYDRLDTENESLRRQLAAYEAEPVVGYGVPDMESIIAMRRQTLITEEADPTLHNIPLIRKPADTKHLDAAIKQATEPLERKLADWTRRSESCESKLGQLEENEKVIELEMKLAEQQAILQEIGCGNARAFLHADICTHGKYAYEDCESCIIEYAAASGTEELTRLLQEAEQRGAVKALRKVGNYVNTSIPGSTAALYIKRMADELEGEKT